MKLEDVKVGMKVVPHSKHGYDLSNSSAWFFAQEANQPYLYVIAIDGQTVTLNETEENNGDFFIASDFKPYTEK